MSKRPFLATSEQKRLVFKRLCKGELAQAVRLEIENPETKAPINLDIFCREFKQEIQDARAKRGSVISSNLYAAASYVGLNNITGLEERDNKAMQQWLALEGRGIFGKKFDFDSSLSLKSQLDQVKDACAAGLIGSQEMSAFVDAIFKEMQLIEFIEIKKEFSELKKLMESKA